MSYLNIGGAQSGDTVNLGAYNPGRLQSQHGPKVAIQLRCSQHDGLASLRETVTFQTARILGTSSLPGGVM